MGLFLSFQRFRTLERRKVLWLVAILKALMLSFSARRKIAGVPLSEWQKCTGLGELACLQHLLDSWSNGKLTMKLETKPGVDGAVVKDKKGKDAKFLVIVCKDGIKLYSKQQQEGGAPFHSGDNDFTYT